MKDEQNMDGKWQTTPVAPWRRFAARKIDILILYVVFLTIMSILKVTHPHLIIKISLAPDVAVYAIFYVFIVVIIGITVGLSGTSIGKWLFGVRVSNEENKPIGIYNGIGRELYVLIYGYWLGVLSIVPLIMSYRRLKQKGNTSWDSEGGYIASYRPSGLFHYFMAFIGLTLFIIISVVLKLIEHIIELQ